jgi:DNA polymerase
MQTKRVYDIVNAGPRHRFVVSGKLVSNCLSLQYGASWRAFVKMCFAQRRMRVAEEDAMKIVKLYRSKYKGVTSTWRHFDLCIKQWSNGLIPMKMPHVPITFGLDYIEGPSGLRLKYPELNWNVDPETGDGSWRYRNYMSIRGGDGWKYIYGANLLENTCQFLAREVIVAQSHRMLKRYPIVGQVHDAVLFVVSDAEAMEACRFINDEMSRSPDWWPQLPVACEVKMGKTYGDMVTVKF